MPASPLIDGLCRFARQFIDHSQAQAQSWSEMTKKLRSLTEAEVDQVEMLRLRVLNLQLQQELDAMKK